jgi:hypothetical protein
MTGESKYKLTEPDLARQIEIAKQGYRTAEMATNWYQVINACPYGPAYPGNGNWRAHAWYRGFWFFMYVVKRWREV